MVIVVIIIIIIITVIIFIVIVIVTPHLVSRWRNERFAVEVGAQVQPLHRGVVQGTLTKIIMFKIRSDQDHHDQD